MKKVLTMGLVLLTMLSLTTAAHADVVVTPVEIAGLYVMRALPGILVTAVVGVTLFLLLKFWKKRK